MIPYGHQSIDKKDIKAVNDVFRSGWLTQGPKVLAFEKKLANYCGAKYAVTVSHGTAALHIAYQAAGFQKGDEIITTPNTFVATSNMLLAVGARPVFCDIRKDTYNIDESKIEKLITKKTKAIVPVHFAGHSCAMANIRAIAKRKNLFIIEDACHALGATYKASKIGSCMYSDMAVFSFHPVKSITTGEGGAVLTNNRDYYRCLLSLRNHGIRKDKNGFNVMHELGYNYRMTDIQAALGINQLKRLNALIFQRKRIAGWYEKILDTVNQITLPHEDKNNYSAWHIYVIRTKNKDDRLPLYTYLLKNGIGVNFHYPCVYQHPYYQKRGFKNVHCPQAEEYAQTAITLPLYPALTKKQIAYITSKILTFFSY